MNFIDGTIDEIVYRKLKKFDDARGWLMEVFRADEIDKGFLPAMAYLSVTHPGIVRGPHEHRDQADLFCFPGPSNFKIYTWDNREDSKTYKTRQVFTAGEDTPAILIVPGGIVHAYKNIGDRDGLVINCPNRLFKGEGRTGDVDEVRYEDIEDSPFKLD
ncbi:MAG: dTDP-4-dehydrorhamnose 3,5-epimerase family protein [Thermodesulfobacteriota bacterium]